MKKNIHTYAFGVGSPEALELAEQAAATAGANINVVPANVAGRALAASRIANASGFSPWTRRFGLSPDDGAKIRADTKREAQRLRDTGGYVVRLTVEFDPGTSSAEASAAPFWDELSRLRNAPVPDVEPDAE